MKTGFIYGLRCPLSGEIRYVGQTIVPLNRRLGQHKCDKRHNPHKTNWINKSYNLGILDNLKIELLEECDKELLNEKERYWIEKYKNNGLVNLTDGGDTNYIINENAIERMRQKMIGKFVGRKLSEETKIKISKSKKGQKLSKEHKKSISDGLILAQNKNRKIDIRTDEQKKLKISISLKKYFLENPKTTKEKIKKERKKHIYSEEEKLEKSKKISGINNPFFGKTHSEESKNKMSENKKDKYIGEKNPFYGKSHTNETKKILSDYVKDKLKNKIIMIDDENNIIKEFTLTTEINNFLNVKWYYNSLRYCLNKNKKYRGFVWRTELIN